MYSINCAGPGTPGEWWWETLVRTVTAPLWLAAMGGDEKQLCVIIADDGVGFGESRQAAHLSLGIRGMRERARALGGAVTLHSEFNKGTVVRLSLPLGDGDGG